MSVLTPERKPRAPRRLPEPRPEVARERPRRAPWGLLALGLALAAAVLVPGWLVGLLPSVPNPFATTTVDRSQPALLRSVQGLEELRAATGHFQVIVDLERDTRLPAAILGERTLFVAAGSVDATVDLGSLASDRVRVSADGTHATITLDWPRLSRPRLDLSRSYVHDRDRGLLNRIGSLLGEESDQRELYLAAERKIAAAAAARSGLVEEARASTRRTLESLVRALGFERVTIRFS